MRKNEQMITTKKTRARWSAILLYVTSPKGKTQNGKIKRERRETQQKEAASTSVA